jgi:short-subunit dehydrogenase
MNDTKPIALITGASSGIGLELAKQFAQNGHDLIVVAEDGPNLNGAASMLRELGGGRVETVVADLAQHGGARQVFDEVQRLGRDVDVLVNNAGVGVYGKFIETSLEEEVSMIHLNTIAYVQLTKFFAPLMVRRGAGRILITASVASKMPTPYLTVYGATKAFVYEFAQGLREELHDTGVTVTALLPGPTDTNFFDRAHANDSKILNETLTDPADVAKAGFDALMKGTDKVIVPFKYKVQSKVGEVVPDPLLAKVARKKHEPREESREGERADERAGR